MTSDPLLLAFDVSTPVGSVAVGRGEEVWARAFLLEPREHAARLLPRIAEVLLDAGAQRSQVEGVVVGRGPGSFTGVRIGAATARGLAMGWEVPVWPRSSLAAAAASYQARVPRSLETQPGFPPVELPSGAEVWPRYVLFDARGDRVYAACYRFSADGMETLMEPHATTISALIEQEVPGPALFSGDGALRHAPALEEAGHLVVPPPMGVPTAEGLLRVHWLHADASPAEPGSRWEPEYLRDSSATRTTAVRGMTTG